MCIMSFRTYERRRRDASSSKLYISGIRSGKRGKVCYGNKTKGGDRKSYNDRTRIVIARQTRKHRPKKDSDVTDFPNSFVWV